MHEPIQTAIARLQALQVGKRACPIDRDAHLNNFDAAKGECGELQSIVADLLVAAAGDALHEIDETMDAYSADRLRAGLSDSMTELLAINEDDVLRQMEAA